MSANVALSVHHIKLYHHKMTVVAPIYRVYINSRSEDFVHFKQADSDTLTVNYHPTVLVVTQY